MLLAACPAAISSQSDSEVTSLVRTVLEKQKDRPFWFHLRSIGFGKVPIHPDCGVSSTDHVLVRHRRIPKDFFLPWRSEVIFYL
jgi:hypothetical protein